MKLTIDTIGKKIQVEGDVNLGELIKVLSGMFPDFSWQEYSMGIAPITYPVYPTYPLAQPMGPYVPSQPWPGTTWEVMCNTDQTIFTCTTNET